MSDITLVMGDCLEVMPTLKGRIDAIITDPPYGVSERTTYKAMSLRKTIDTARA